MNPTGSRLALYETDLRATIGWLRQSIQNGDGGSSAHFSPVSGWAGPYPETTGYLIPTLLQASEALGDGSLVDDAIALGHWLLQLQHGDGWWPGGLLKQGQPTEPSVFNTAQILDGMVALFRQTVDIRWKQAAAAGASWLANGVGPDGLFGSGNYRQGNNPTYYSQVAWPMLEVWRITGNPALRAAALRVLDRIVASRNERGVFVGWGFENGKPAFTHTIAYTLRGLIESAYILDDWTAYGEPAMAALERLARKAELTSGRLPGAFDDDWRGVNWFSCLTGNAQIALCLLRIEPVDADLRLVNAAAKLVDYVAGQQQISSRPAATFGAVAGSSPFWGRYMFLRYPNWAAKYHADVLIALRSRLLREGLAR